MPSNPRYLAALQGEQLKRVAERSFPAFVRQAWPILEPTTAFLPNWHIDLVCEYLEAVTAGEIRRLVINLPPRYGKSLLVSVLWPVWEWIRHPATRWVFTSYAESLAGQHSQDRRTLLQSPWYCRHWGPRVSLTHPTEASEYWNAQRGRMLATSVGAAVTGKGGNRIVVDDPHTPLGAESDAQRHRVIEYFRRSVATRLDDKQRGAIVVVMQRLHAQDLTATCLDLGYTHLCLPAEATSRTTITFPRSGRVVTRAPGDLLWPAREGPEEMAQRTVELGAYGFAGQYQQSPSPRTGGLFERRWWAFYDDLPTGVDAGIQSWDLSVKGGPGHDFVVGLVAAGRGADIYLVDRVKAQLSFPDTLAAIRQTCRQYPSARTILVEDTANGPAVIDTLRHEIPGIIAVQPQGDKVQRATACAPRVEAGNVYLPRPTGPNGRRLPARAWVDDFIEQLAAFPMGAHDDDVDAFTQLLLRWHARRMSPEMVSRCLMAGRGSLPAAPLFLKRFSNRPCTTWGGRGTSARTDAGGPMRAYSMDLRERVLLDSDAGMKAAEVAAKYRVSGSWVRLLKQRRRETGEAAPRVQRQGRRGMLEPHLHTLAALIAAHPDRTLAELKDALATPASVPTVWRAVRALGLTVKKTVRPSEHDRPDVAAARVAWHAAAPTWEVAHLVFLDETGITTNLLRRYGRAPRGARVHDHAPCGRWQTSTFLAAWRVTGLTAPGVFDGAIDGESFRAYIDQILVPTLHPGDIVIADNLGAHKVAGIQRTLQAAGATLWYLPPYSPDLNPIELCFAKLKALVRTARCRSTETLWPFLGQCLAHFSPDECRNYFRHCGYSAATRS